MIPAGLRDNLARVRDRIDSACRRAGRNPSDVKLIAVTKYASDDEVRAILDLGVRDLGESRAVEGAARASRFGGDVQWHFIGHLQTNKVARVLSAFHWLHSLDRQDLAEVLDKRCVGRPHRLPIFVQVNVSGEKTKGGFSPEGLSRTTALLHLDFCPHLAIKGLMTMAPEGDAESSRPYFRRLRELAAQCQLPLLSMGMSNDFEVAIEEGATHIRLGTALFGNRG